jgi:hypothetical protein
MKKNEALMRTFDFKQLEQRKDYLDKYKTYLSKNLESEVYDKV